MLVLPRARTMIRGAPAGDRGHARGTRVRRGGAAAGASGRRARCGRERPAGVQAAGGRPGRRRRGAVLGDYVHGPLRAARTLRFGIDPELAGTRGRHPGGRKPVDQARTLRRCGRCGRPARSSCCASTGCSRPTARPASAASGGSSPLHAGGLRYRDSGPLPPVRAAGREAWADWTRYVRHVVDAFGSDRHVVAMTITNEINLAFSPNTSDGAYPRAEQALIQGIIAAHREARRRGFTQLRFGFTFAYRFDPVIDAAMFAALRRGGAAFRRALGFVGVDYYPELCPGPGNVTVSRPRPSADAGDVRRCFMPLGGLGRRADLDHRERLRHDPGHRRARSSSARAGADRRRRSARRQDLRRDRLPVVQSPRRDLDGDRVRRRRPGC